MSLQCKHNVIGAETLSLPSQKIQQTAVDVSQITTTNAFFPASLLYFLENNPKADANIL